MSAECRQRRGAPTRHDGGRSRGPARVRQAGPGQQPRAVRAVRGAGRLPPEGPMRPPDATSRRVRIDRLELDLRGIAPATAEAAVRALGPALAAALAPARGQMVPAARVDAGNLTSD